MKEIAFYLFGCAVGTIATFHLVGRLKFWKAALIISGMAIAFAVAQKGT